ncbi:MAG: VOC family protein [Pseudomonadota bacterium]
MGQPFLEIGTDDAAATRDFFAAVFDWSWTGEIGEGWFETGAGPIGLHGGDAALIVPYFSVADIEAGLAAVQAAGGSVLDGVTRETGFGAFATCADPRGVRFGLHERLPDRGVGERP